MSRKSGYSNGLDLDRLNWGNYDLVVIDESHNFRNGEGTHKNQVENRYVRLMEKVIRAGVRTKVLMLSATPVNNNFMDLKNQLALAYEGNPNIIDEKLKTDKSVDEIFRQAQRAFNEWGKLELECRTTENLLKKLDFDFFELLDNVTIARSRKHIEKYYNTAEIGKFPERLAPISYRPCLTSLPDAVNYTDIYDALNNLSLVIYTPSLYIFPSKIEKYKSLTHNKGENLTQIGRERGIQRLMTINLLKRLESSVHSFYLTLTRIKSLIDSTLEAIDNYIETGIDSTDMQEISESELDIYDSNTDLFTVGKKVKISLADMDYTSWRAELAKDSEILELLNLMVADITPEHDSKLNKLKEVICHKIENPINDDNKKIIIFSAFSDTAEYLYENISEFIKKKYNLNTAVITGSIEGRSTIKGLKGTLNNVLICFSPVSKGRDLLMPNSENDIDILIATDCISEGQNLQDCDYLINYDIHWNPVRIVYPFLLKVQNDCSENKITIKEMKEIIKLCIDYVLRRNVCDVPTNSHNKTFATLKNTIRYDDYLNSIKAYFILQNDYKFFPDDETFIAALCSKEIYKMRNRNFILSHLENYQNKAPIIIENYTIEHIMPQNSNLSKEWQSELGTNWKDIQRKYLNTIGNLTLTAYNSEMSDRPFMKKMNMDGGFKQSALRLNKYVVLQNSWNEKCIMERAKELAMLAVKIWQYPQLSDSELEVYSRPVSSEERYSLDTYLTNTNTLILYEALEKRIMNLSADVKKEL